jgi:hypothetical protein
MLRSVLSVVAAIAALTAASFAIELALEPILLKAFPQAFPDPSALSRNQWMRLVTFTYSPVCVAGGGYVTARIAPRLPVRQAAAMGLVQAALTIMAMFSLTELAPRWQWITSSVLCLPVAAAGGVLFSKRRFGSR